ncbi:MAG TPA: VOC family protein [Candidatus Saccharimonadales bacterium]|nr:VOC family protein [Candidatus Saccharimonadales bacterium]
MLDNSDVLAMVPVKDIKESEKFYSETLGLKKIDENMAGVTYQCGSGKLFVYPTPTAGTAKSTVATWEVSDIAKVAKELKEKGMEFEHYDYPGATHEGDVHIWEGAKAAWFRDPSGNILGLSQMK